MTTTLNNFTVLTVTQLTTSELTLVSSATSEKKFLGAIEVFNTSLSNVEITLWLIPTADTGTTGSGSNESYVRTIPARSSKVISEFQGQIVDFVQKFSGKASVTGVINITVSGSTDT